MSLFASVLYTGMRSVEAWSQGVLQDAWFSDMLSRVFLRSVTIDSVIYMTILVAVHAFEYYRKYRRRTLEAEQLKADLAQAQLHALSLQLRPHFLFNTFHTIAMLVRRHEEKKATETIASLSDFLRYVLESDGAQEVSLQQELKFVERYAAVEKARFEDQIEVRIEAAPDALRAQVPNLLLQPLVENAVRHGIRPTGRAGRIDVDARREGAQLRLRVRDDGTGLPSDWDLDEHRGVGLSNTRARLQRLYGADHHLTFSPAPAMGGLMVTIVLPYRTAEREREPRPARAGRGRSFRERLQTER